MFCKSVFGLIATSCLIGQASASRAEDASASAALVQPAITGPLAANPNPVHFDAGVLSDALGPVYVSGVLSGLGLAQDGVVAGDRRGQADLSNAQVIIQTTGAPLQIYVEAGAYSLPALGTAYSRARHVTSDSYGVLPVAYAKWAIDDRFSVMAGQLPSLIGAEYTFTFENMNIERGLLWNQENAISHGVQGNYADGPFALSVAWTDGFYSDRWSWLSGSVSWTVDPDDTVALMAGGNFGQSSRTDLATPVYQNNSRIIDLSWVSNVGNWQINPYLQYTDVPENTGLGIVHGSSTWGAALLARYAMNDLADGLSLPFRAEYVSSSGRADDGSVNLLYGPGSDAWSLTVSPTWQQGIFFARTELSYVGAHRTAGAAAFGADGQRSTQWRGVVETGFLF